MKKYKLFTSLFLSLVLSSLFFSPVFAASVEGENVKLKIFHTNDTHARYEYKEDSVIGYSKLKTLKDQENPDLLVDAGDIFHGQSFATIETGESIASLMKAVGYDAMASGNHDFNYGSARLKELGELANTKILGANVLTKNNLSFFKDDHLIKEVSLDNGETVKLGVFGLISPDIYSDTAPSNVSGLSFGDHESIIKTAQASVDQLKAEGCDVIVTLMHVGDSTNGMLRSDTIAKSVNGIDVIIDGHTHDVENTIVNGTLIAQTGYYFNNIGVVDLTLEKKTAEEFNIIDKKESLITAKESAAVKSDETIDALITEIKERQSPILNTVVGNIKVDLDWSWEKVRTQELNLGRVASDAYRFTTQADIAIENAGGLRAAISAGDITKGEVINVLPFGNYLVTKKILGSDIQAMLEKNIQIQIDNNVANDSGDYNAWPGNSGSYLQWSGVKATYDLKKPQGQRVDSKSILIGNKMLDPTRLYTVATSNFAAGSEDYPALKKAEILNEYAACDEALITYLEKAGAERLLEAVTISNIVQGSSIREIPVSYSTHIENSGWQNPVTNASISGTKGQNLRLEAIKINLGEGSENLMINYKTHVQDSGWENEFKSNGAISGTEGQAKRAEAIQIKLTGSDADLYDIYYQVHIKDRGWLSWAKNGETAGTEGQCLPLEAIKIVAIPKGETAPDSIDNAFVN